MTAETILAIPLDEPERLFDRALLNVQYKNLAKQWHPDLNHDPKAGTVFDHIVKLHRAAILLDATSLWKKPGIVEVFGTDGKVVAVPYERKTPFELGVSYYGPKFVVFEIRKSYTDLFLQAKSVLDNLDYRDTPMYEEMSRYFPRNPHCVNGKNGDLFVVCDKTEDVFRLDDVLAVKGGSLEPAHVAWVLNTAYNIACYMEWAGLTHNAITPSTYFLSPKFHSGLLLGGWWYAAKTGERLFALPHASFKVAPPDIVRSKKADPRLDLAMIRVMGQQLLGRCVDPKMERMLRFLKSPTSGSAKVDYRIWSNEVLPACFGKRRFVELNVEAADIWQLPKK